MAGNAGVAIRKARSQTARPFEQQPAERHPARSGGRSATERVSRSASVSMLASGANLLPPTTTSEHLVHKHARRKSTSDLDEEFDALLAVGGPSDSIPVEKGCSDQHQKEAYAVTVERTQALMMAADDEEQDVDEDEGISDTLMEAGASALDTAPTNSQRTLGYCDSLTFAAARISAKLSRMRRHTARLEFTGDLQSDIETLYALAQ